MNYILIFGLILLLAAIVAGFRFAWGLLEQHGRMLLRMEALEKQVEGKADSRRQKWMPRRLPRPLPAIGASAPSDLATVRWPTADSNATD